MVELMELYWIFGAYTFLMFGIGIYILYNGSFQKKAAEDDADKECTICLSEQSNAIVMPCGHMCVCMDCGNSLKTSKHNLCPVCRGAIQSLIPFKR